MIGFVWLAAAAGDLVSFLLGRRLGRPFLERHGPRFHLGPDRLARVDRFYGRHGGKAVLLGRFTGLVRAVSPFVAGASGLAFRRFVVWSAAGALLWATTFTLVGYGFSESFAESGETAARIGAGAALAAALVFVAVARLRSGGRGGRRGVAHETEHGEGAERPEPRPERRRRRARRAGSAPAGRRARGPRPQRCPAPRGACFGHRIATAVAAAKAVALWPDGKDGLPGIATSDPRSGSATGGRSRSKASLSQCTTSDATPVATAAAANATGRRRRQTSDHRPRPTSSGPLTHQADSTTNTAVSSGCSKA